MIEVRFHGRGGQGAVTCSRILANAFVRTDRYGASFPMFGFERRGAPVVAFGRFGDEPIREKTQIYNPDILVVLDPSQKDTDLVWNGLNTKGTMILNSTDNKVNRRNKNLETVGVVDATGIALEEIGMAMPNTSMLGAFAKVTGLLELDPIMKGLEDYFSGKKLDVNLKCAERGFYETEIIKL